MTRGGEGPTLVLPVGPRDHAEGPASAPATLVEYGDYECPHCGRAYPIVKAVQKRLGRRLCFVFRNFPLKEVHPHAEHAAEAAEAAGAQGKFWQMHDALFENQEALDDEDLLATAAGLGLDARRTAAELTAHAHAARVREDFLSGVRSGVNGTPTFFLNGQRYDGSWDEEELVAAIEQEIS
ncbi:MAG: disulfide bond formation protein DsbA [Candidatus Rokuibacteriota bacterium]|nr:MAG: disulfide bond formation protein DsbA [Candidatus Rokubacteria bacterium]